MNCVSTVPTEPAAAFDAGVAMPAIIAFMHWRRGPHPRRELTLTPRLGFRMSSLAAGPHAPCLPKLARASWR